MDLLSVNDRPGEYPPSYYAATAQALAPFPKARGAISCDVCVVGGGYSGLSAALHLAEMGFDVVLLEAQRVGFGASGRNGGQVGTGQRRDQASLERMVGDGPARALWDAGLEAVDLVRALIQTHGMDCGFHEGIIYTAHRARLVPAMHAEVAHLEKRYGYDKAHCLDKAALAGLVGSPAYHGGALDLGGGHLHPLRYALGLARAAANAGVRIFEGTTVTEVSQTPCVLRTKDAQVTARHVILGANGYLGALQGAVAARVMPINNYIVATEPLPRALAESLIRDNRAVADSKFVVNYFRLSEDLRLLFGGTESYSYRFPRDIAAKVRRPMLEIFPQLAQTRIEYAWGGTLGITTTRMPHFARLKGNILSLGGYSGHGVAMATLGGKYAALAVAGQAQSFDLMAQVPTPRFPGGARLRWPLLVSAMVWYALRDRL